MRSLSLLVSFVATFSVIASASAHDAARINEGLMSMRARAEHLERVLTARRMPSSITQAPERVIRTSLKRDLGPRLETGLAQDARITIDDRSTRIEADGNRTTRTEANVRLTALTGTPTKAVSSQQYVQSTAETRQANRDPRHGILVTDIGVTQWKTASSGAGNGWIYGPTKIRYTTPIAQGLHFRGEKLPTGSHLVTTRTQNGKQNQQMAVLFGNDDLPNAQMNGYAQRSYLLRPDTSGRLAVVRLSAQEAADLAAHLPFKAYRLQDGEAVPVHSAGYDHESLKQGGFVE